MNETDVVDVIFYEHDSEVHPLLEGKGKFWLVSDVDHYKILTLLQESRTNGVENDDLRAQLLKAPNAKMVAYIAACELWVEQERRRIESTNDDSGWDSGFECAIVEVARVLKQLKTKHLETENENER